VKLLKQNNMSKKGQLTTADPLIGQEFQRLLKCLHDDGDFFWELYARLSFCTACRSSDVRALRWKDIMGNGIQITEKKTGKVRVIPFNKAVQEKIHELYRLMKCPPIEELIFLNKKTGKAVTIQGVNKQLKKIKERYDIDVNHFSSHSLRKTFGRFVYDQPGDKSDHLLKLNMILKHSSIEVTKRYIGITNDELNELFSSINI